MKKILATALVMILALSFHFSVLAAPSPEEIVDVVTATDSNGNAIEITISATEKTISAAEVASVVGSETATVLSIQEVSVPDGTQFPVTIEFSVIGVTSTTVVYVLHWNNETNEWEKINAVAGEGIVTCTFDSLSPVAFVVDDVINSENNSSQNYLLYIVGGIVVVVVLIGAVYALTRSKKDKSE